MKSVRTEECERIKVEFLAVKVKNQVLVSPGREGTLAVYYSSTQSFLIRWLHNMGSLLNFD